MRRLLIESIEEEWAILPEKEVHHFTRVLRKAPGTRFEGITQEGEIFICRLEEEQGTYRGRIIERLGSRGESPFRILLAPALIKRSRFEWLVQKATELGVDRILPLATHRSEIHLDEKRASRKTDRWRRITEEAVKQCGRSRVPQVEMPVQLSEALGQAAGMPILFFDEDAEAGCRGLTEKLQGLEQAAVFVGPEGGWAEEERMLFRKAGALRLGLGPRILRAETAAIVALALLQHELGDLSGLPFDSPELDV